MSFVRRKTCRREATFIFCVLSATSAAGHFRVCRWWAPHKVPNTFLRHHISRIVVDRPIYYLFPYFLRHESSQRALLITFVAQLAMSLVVPDSIFGPLDQLPPSALRRLRRRSSCPSIPRSVSICSSVFGFDSSSEDLSHSGACDDRGIYMSPLFRGMRGSGEVDTEVVEEASDTPTEGSTPKTQSIPCDDHLFESLSDYNFDIIGHEDVPDTPKASEGNHGEQSLTPVHSHSPSVQTKTSILDSQASQPLPPSRYFSPSLDEFPPVPPLKIRHVLPPNTGTRPLQIDRPKMRPKSSRTPQPLPPADVRYKPPPPKSILRTTTQGDLRRAYRRTSPHPHAERKMHAREVIPIVPSPLHTQPKGQSPNPTEVINDHRVDVMQRVNLPSLQQVPVATLFPTGLIPLERAQDKFKHAHCLERLPPPPVPSDSPTSSQGDHSQRIRGWSLSRAFKRQKA